MSSFLITHRIASTSRLFLFFILMTGLLALVPTIRATTTTWDASGTNPAAPTDGAGTWSTANVNWSNGSTDNVWTNGDSAIFGSGGAGGVVSVGAGTIVSSITLNTNYSLSVNSLTLTNTPTITVNGAVTIATNNVVLAGVGYTKTGSGTLQFSGGVNNSYSGQTIINAGALYSSVGNDTAIAIPGDLLINPGAAFVHRDGAVGGGPIIGSATVIVNGGTISNTINPKTISINKLVLDNNGLLVDSTGAGYFTATNMDLRSGIIRYGRYRNGTMTTFKSTAGMVTITNRPNTAATDGYLVTMNAGTLIFDKSSGSSARLLPNGGLTLGGGFLLFTNSNTAVNPSTENPGTGNTTINPGASFVMSTNPAPATGGSVTFGGFFRKTGGTLDFFKNAAGASSTTNVNVNSIQGGWATWNKSEWLVGTTLAPLATYTSNNVPTSWLAANNVTFTNNPSANLDDVTINSLRLNAAYTVTINSAKTLTLASGGLLVTGTGADSITGGTLKGASGADLVIHQYSTGDLTINSTLADNGTATSLTKSGTGKLVISGTDTMTGTNFLNGGVVEVSDLAKLASGPLFMNAGALRYTGSSTTENRAVTVNGLGATFDVTGGTTLTLASPIKGSGAAIGDMGGLVKIGAGTLVLTASNYFNGGTVVSNGVLVINGTNAYDKATWNAGNVSVYGGTLGGTGLIAGLVTVKNGGTLSPGASPGTLTLATNLLLESGSTNLFEITNSPGTSDLLVVKGNLSIQTNSTISISAFGSSLAVGTYTLIQYSGTKTGSFNSTPAIAGGSISASFAIDESTPGQINLVVSPQVVITSQPADAVVSTNLPVTFTVTATGSPVVGYQWYRYADNSGSSPVGQTDATNASFTIASAQGSDTGYYGVIVTNASNSATSRVANLIVGNIVPAITGPTNKTVIAGNSVTFNTTVVIANPAAAFQWQTNGVNVGGATSSALTLASVSYGLNGTVVSVIATNIAGMITNSATLTVIVTPVITPQPASLVVNVGSPAVFTSGATGVPTPVLQWYKNGVAISGETSSTLTIASAQGSDIGTYSLVASNAAGTATSGNASLVVNSTTLASTAFAPVNGASGVGYDTPLYVTFNGAISVVNSGKIRIYNVTNSVTPVDTIDMSSNTVIISPGINLTNNIQPHSLFSGDTQVINYFPVIVTGSTAAIYPHSGVMTSNQTYYVTLDNGIVRDSSGAYFAGISATNAWQFTTKLTGPVTLTNLVVAADGSGDFVTVQGAVDSIPAGNNTYTLINIRNGNYVEIVNISGKSNVTFRGQSRTGTVVGYANNNNLTGTTAARMAFKVNANDIKIENLTLTNGTPQGGSQAETLLIYNNGLRCVVNNCDIISRQDTILINANASQGLFNNCRIVGNFDYVWGSGVGYFNNCVIHTITNTLSGSYNLTAARTQTAGTLSTNTPWVNPNGTLYSANGFSFVGCTIEADSGVTGITLAGSNGTVGGLDSWVNCLIDTNAYTSPSTTLSNTYVFWQNNNKEITGSTAISFTNVQTIGVTNNDPRLLAATNVTTWFYGWTPQLAPNILTNPVSQTVNYTAPATFSVAATGIPAPTYQWQHAGTNLPSATSSSLTIASATSNDAGSYAVIVTTPSGTATSTTATLTVNPPNTAPVFTAPPAGTNIAINVGVNLSVACTATDSDTPAQTLVYALLTGPSGATLNTNSGVLTWRPTVVQAGSSNSVSVAVTDNGIPNLSATNSFSISVNLLTQPSVDTTAYAAGQFTLSVGGQVGPDYTVQVSTNLTDGIWNTLYTTNPATMPFSFTDPNGALPVQFYRILVGP